MELWSPSHLSEWQGAWNHGNPRILEPCNFGTGLEPLKFENPGTLELWNWLGTTGTRESWNLVTLELAWNHGNSGVLESWNSGTGLEPRESENWPGPPHYAEASWGRPGKSRVLKLGYFLPATTAWISESISSGVCLETNLFKGCPWRSMRNLVKFQPISVLPSGSGSAFFRNW